MSWIHAIDRMTSYIMWHMQSNTVHTYSYFHRAGQLDMSTALSLTAYLEKEREYIPWSTALGHLGFIGSMLSMRSSYGDYEVNHPGRGRAKQRSLPRFYVFALFCFVCLDFTYHAVGGTWAKMYTIINQRNYLFIVRRVLRFLSFFSRPKNGKWHRHQF